MAKRILLIYTGGTIGMKADVVTGTLKPLDFREIYDEIPALRKLDVEIESHEGISPIDSSDVTPDMWLELGCVIGDNYDKFDGFVVLHGTDTMAYTASALSFILENLGKPIVFTGSQIPIGVLRTDGRENLVTAVEIASAYDSEQKPMVPEVSIYFQNKLFRANRTTKWSAEQLNAFTSENYSPLAEVGVSIRYNHSAIDNWGEFAGKLSISGNLCSKVLLIRLFPGMEPAVFRAMLSIPELRGVVLQTYGAGNTPTAEWFIEEIETAIRKGIIIVNVTQCLAGKVTPMYESARRLAQAGVISGHDMTVEAAMTKLMYVLGRNLNSSAAQSEINRPLRGEFTY